MQEPATALWDLSISDTDLDKLTAGFEPQEMEDRWHVTVTDQSQNGTSSIHFARSWTGIEHYVLLVKPNDGGSSSGGGAKVEAITWEQNKGGIRISEEQAKKEVAFMARNLLECRLEVLPEYDFEEVFNHPGTLLSNGTSS